VIEPRFRWQFPAPVTLTDPIREASGRHGLDQRVAGLLVRRGLLDVAAFDEFFAPPLAGLHDPNGTASGSWSSATSTPTD
jgi:hypothetical protein